MQSRSFLYQIIPNNFSRFRVKRFWVRYLSRWCPFAPSNRRSWFPTRQGRLVVSSLSNQWQLYPLYHTCLLTSQIFNSWFYRYAIIPFSFIYPCTSPCYWLVNSQSAPHTRECVVLLRVVISGLLSLDARPTLLSVLTNNQGLVTSFENIKQRLPVLFNVVTKFRDPLPAHVIVQVMWQQSDTPLAQLVDQLSEVGRMFFTIQGHALPTIFSAPRPTNLNWPPTILIYITSLDSTIS